MFLFEIISFLVSIQPMPVHFYFENNNNKKRLGNNIVTDQLRKPYRTKVEMCEIQ